MRAGQIAGWWSMALAVIALAAPLCAGGQGYAGDVHEAFGPQFAGATARQRPLDRPVRRSAETFDRILFWNQVAIDASGLDHTPVAAGESRVFGEQLGPGRSSRAMAIVHVAMFDALNAITRRYQSYTGLPFARADASVDAAIAQAAHDALVAMFPSQRRSFDDVLAEDLALIADTHAKAAGLDVGRRAAAAILALRSGDGSHYVELRMEDDFKPRDQPGYWRQDPISQIPLALGALWGHVEPFVLDTAAQFRTPPPPALASADYAMAFDEVKRLGGDGVVTPTERSAEQTRIGIYWAYDGTPSLCAPPRLYNQIATQLAMQQRSNAIELARLLALVNVAMADAGVAIWESKYHYQFWRPVTGIREADAGSGPTGLGDGNPLTLGDVAFSPFGAPFSNGSGPNFTPPFPAYPSGHAGFGGALFQTLRRFYGTDDIAFTFVSDELNGTTLDRDGNVRPLMPRSFSSLSQAEEENGQSRVYLGIHWSFDKTAGIEQGRRVADYVFDSILQPRKPSPR